MLSRLCLMALLVTGPIACTEATPPSSPVRGDHTSTGRVLPATVTATPESIRIDGAFRCQEVRIGETGKYSAIATGGTILNTTGSDIQIKAKFEVRSGNQSKESTVGYLLSPSRKLTRLTLSGAGAEGGLLTFSGPIDRCEIEVSTG